MMMPMGAPKNMKRRVPDMSEEPEAEPNIPDISGLSSDELLELQEKIAERLEELNSEEESSEGEELPG